MSLEPVMADNENCENETGESIPEDFIGEIAGEIDSNNIEVAEIGDAYNVDDRGKEIKPRLYRNQKW